MAEEKKYEITKMELKMYIGLAMADTIPEGAAREEEEKLSGFAAGLCKRITSCCCYWHGMDKRVCGGVKVSHTFLLVYFIKSNYTVSSES